MLSAEDELHFQIPGKITKINWQDSFDYYKKLLFANSKKVKSIYLFFNENIFGKVSSAITESSTTDTGDASEEVEYALRALNDDDDDETKSTDHEVRTCRNWR